MSKIPKIIHQLWIGEIPPPLKMMNTWKEKHPNCQYIYWNENEFQARGMGFCCAEKINNMKEINGKADIMRWEILEKYGGVFVDADSICIEPLDDSFFQTEFAGFENENCRRGLVATGTMGFAPNSPICRDIIEWILNSPEADASIANHRAWFSVGPALFTRFLATGKYPEITIYPSYLFLPHHFTGDKYRGHRRIYAYQEWGTTKSSYGTIDTVSLPVDLLPPEATPVTPVTPSGWVSVLISSFNTPREFLTECLNSIADQMGHFGIELVWVNDGSTAEYTAILERELEIFRNTTRFTRVVYKKLDENRGLYESLSIGVKLCLCPLIFRMDADDVMFSYRILHQYQYMINNPGVVISSTGIRLFTDKRKIIKDVIHPPVVTREDVLTHRPSWFMNQPGMCFYKKAVMELGNYNHTIYHKNMMEDYALELRFLQKYGAVHNMQEVLIYYRIHPEQLTAVNEKVMESLKPKMIEDILG
jgi:hypothetical protein